MLLRPHVRLAFDVDELRCDPNPVAGPPDTALEQEVDAEFAADLVRALGGVLVLHRRRARDHAKSRWLKPAELGDHLFSKPVGEVLLVWIAGQVLERQHGQHDSRRYTRAIDKEPDRCDCSDDHQYDAAKRQGCPAPSGRRRAGRPRFLSPLDRVVECVAVTRDGADEARGRTVSEYLANLADQVRQILFNDEGVRPEPVLKVCLRQCLRAVGDQNLEQLERLGRQPDGFGAPPQLAGVQIEHELAKRNQHRSGRGRVGHSNPW